MIEFFIRKHGHLNLKDVQGVSSEALSAIMSHDFPGNIRELENIIEYATLVSKGEIVEIGQLPDYLREAVNTKGDTEYLENPETDVSWCGLESDFIYEALRKNNWNRVATAAQLGIHTTTLWRKIKSLKIQTPRQDGRTKKL